MAMYCKSVLLCNFLNHEILGNFLVCNASFSCEGHILTNFYLPLLLVAIYLYRFTILLKALAC